MIACDFTSLRTFKINLKPWDRHDARYELKFNHLQSVIEDIALGIFNYWSNKLTICHGYFSTNIIVRYDSCTIWQRVRLGTRGRHDIGQFFYFFHPFELLGPSFGELAVLSIITRIPDIANLITGKYNAQNDIFPENSCLLLLSNCQTGNHLSNKYTCIDSKSASKTSKCILIHLNWTL